MRGAGLCARIAAALLIAAGAAGCGEDIQSPDLFVLTRTGEGARLTMLVNYDGSIRCNRGRTRELPDPLLIQARVLSTALDGDAVHHLKIAVSADSVYRYSIELPDGTISFPDTAGRSHPNLAQAELFTVQAAQQGCGLSGT